MPGRTSQLLLLILFFSVSTWAEAESSKLSVKAPEEAVPKKWKVGGSLTMSTASTVDTEVPRSISGMYLAGVTFSKLKMDATEETPPEYILSGATGLVTSYTHEGGAVINAYGDDLTGNDTFGIINPMFSIAKPLGTKWGLDSVTLKSGLTVGGVSRRSQKTSFQGSLSASIGYDKAWGKYTFSQGFKISYAQFEYETSTSGKLNKPWSATFSNALKYQINEKYTASVSAGILQQTSYTGVIQNITSTGLDVGYTATEKLSVNAGVSNMAGTLAANGQDAEITLYRPDLAIIYLDLSLAL